MKGQKRKKRKWQQRDIKENGHDGILKKIVTKEKKNVNEINKQIK